MLAYSLHLYAQLHVYLRVNSCAVMFNLFSALLIFYCVTTLGGK